MKHITATNYSHLKANSTTKTVTLRALVTIGGTGAPTVSKSPDSGFAISRTSTGLYAITYPLCKNAWFDIALISPLATVVTSILVATNANAGTASFNTLAGTNAAAVTDPASGDVIQITIHAEC